MKELEQEIQRTLSFFEPMNLEKIFLDLDDFFLEENRNLTMQDVYDVLNLLEKKKLVTKSKIEDKDFWLKNFPKKSFLSRLKRFIRTK